VVAKESFKVPNLASQRSCPSPRSPGGPWHDEPRPKNAMNDAMNGENKVIRRR